MVHQAGIEPATYCLEGSCSIHWATGAYNVRNYTIHQYYFLGLFYIFLYLVGFERSSIVNSMKKINVLANILNMIIL